ncbi:MAG: pyruvate kinase, partial [Xanthomonadales bacterium]|nr:pyruvate kinase [Xanthomonadales bacterium]
MYELTRLKSRRTRIVATLGPASSDASVIAELIAAGANVFRLNMSHGDHASHAAAYETVRSVSEEMQIPVAILADLCGPKIRVGRFRDGGIDLEAGSEVTVTTRDVVGEPGLIPSQYDKLAEDVAVGQRLLLADGLMSLEVLSIEGTEVRCRVIDGGRLTERKGINLPDSEVSAPCLTEKDREDAVFCAGLGVDFMALSFVCRGSDVTELAELLEGEGCRAGIIAKIERPEAVRRIDEILEVATGIMVARGDLGVELPAERVPATQQYLVDRARQQHRPVIVATQMLESMIDNPRPTRAEVTDVAHSVAMGADAVMLSAETAAGAYPLQAVQTMDRVARETEAYLWTTGQFDALRREREAEPPRPFGVAVGRATALLSRDLMVRAIFVTSRSGQSAVEVCGERPA